MSQPRMGKHHFVGLQGMVNLSKLLFPKTNKLTHTLLTFYFVTFGLQDIRKLQNSSSNTARMSMPQPRMGAQHFLRPHAMVNSSKLLFPKTNKLTRTQFWLLILSLFDYRTNGNRKIPHRTRRGYQCHNQRWERSTSLGCI